MRKFFQEYGGVALGILALLVLIAMITPVGNIVKTSLQGTVHKTAIGIESQTDTMGQQLEESFINASRLADFSSINTTYVKGDFSQVGNYVEINGTRFLVVSLDAWYAKVVSMESIGNDIYNNGETMYFGETEGAKYDGSVLDNLMNSYYDALPSELQSLIVDQDIIQSIYTWYGSNVTTADDYAFLSTTNDDIEYRMFRVGETYVGKRKVVALDIDDVLKLLGREATFEEISRTFFETSNSSSDVFWLRSAIIGQRDFGSYVHNGLQYLGGTYGSRSSYQIRPSFVLNLEKLVEGDNL